MQYLQKMPSIISLIFPALAPAIADGLRGMFAKFTGGAGGNPQNVDERVKLMQAEAEKIKAMAELDNPLGTPSQWIIDLRAAYRYVIITVIFLFTGISMYSVTVPLEIKFILLDMTGCAMSFVIGERMYLAVRNNNR